MRLSVEDVTAGYGRKTVVHGISLAIESGEVLCLLGANGSGKTTLFKTILGLLRPSAGRVCIDGADIAHCSRVALARALGYVPQAHTPPFPFRVRDVVLMARSAHLRVFSSPGRRDVAVAEAALERLNILRLADELYTEVSGGERQLVLIARALTQESQILVLDEPTSSLDFGNQALVLRHIKELAAGGLGLLMTTHVPNQAFLCASRVALLKHGRMLALDRPEVALTQECLQEAYGTPLRIVEPEPNLRLVVPRMN
jgi:ABC-type cobalamin/Fe3+-siderophores transport system ATPase subunit